MAERFVEVGGTRLFLDVRGEPYAPPLLYLHGGPGASCHTFMSWQGDLLARRLRVVGLDQRGVLRSDPLAAGETLTEQALVDDCEAVREALGIPRWTVLGHSFGGRVALRYAVRHPDRVAAVLFENPCWDFDDTERQRLPAAAAIFDELGDRASAARCRELAARPERLTDWRESAGLVARLHEHGRYDDLYVRDPRVRAAWQAAETDAFPEELYRRTGAHSEQAMAGCLEDLRPLLADLAVPAVLIVGGHDLVCGPAQVEAFTERVPRGHVHRFPQAGHLVHVEDPGPYADLVDRCYGWRAGSVQIPSCDPCHMNL